MNAVANNSDCQPFGMGEMCIELTEEGGFEVVESDPGDSAFETSAPVVCVECGRSIPFCEWDEPSGRSVEGDS